MGSNNIVWDEGRVSKEDRSNLLGQENKVLWFTGLSGSGKSAVARLVEKKLHEAGRHCYVLDGDNIRHGLNKNLGFSKEDREENIRRVREVAKLFHDAGSFVLCSFISPYNKDREEIRKLVGEDFVEIFVDCPLEVCEKRDVKGMYSMARSGEIKDFTGVSAPYEVPENPELVLKTEDFDVEECAEKVLFFLGLK